MIIDAKRKSLDSEAYHFVYDMDTGHFMRWGRTFEDKVLSSPFGPEIVDMEVSTRCHGLHGIPCHFCYKRNGVDGVNMSLRTFKEIFAKLPPVVTQIAFGVGDIDANPYLIEMFVHCRRNDVVPNITVNGARLTDRYVQALAILCGGISVSRYSDVQVCYDAVRRLQQAGAKQVSIHQLLSAETFEACEQVVQDVIDGVVDPFAIVFLAVKPVGRGSVYHPLVDEQRFMALMSKCVEHGVRFGTDSCYAPQMLKCFNMLRCRMGVELSNEVMEPCESTLFSLYIDVNGIAKPCSFCGSWGVSVLEAKDFLMDVWMHPLLVEFREQLLATEQQSVVGCRQCPMFELF